MRQSQGTRSQTEMAVWGVILAFTSIASLKVISGDVARAIRSNSIPTRTAIQGQLLVAPPLFLVILCGITM